MFMKVYDELVKLNSDTVGWLTVNNTKINYPVVQTKDNDYYLSENNVLFDIDKEELIVYAVKKTDTSYTVPATVKKIHRAAFDSAKNLKSKMIISY